MPLSTRLADLNRLHEERPDWLFSDLLKKTAQHSYRRTGVMDELCQTLIPLAEAFEREQSSALKDHPLALMNALAQHLGGADSFARKYSDNQPRVPAVSPDDGQWTSIDVGPQPHSSQAPSIRTCCLNMGAIMNISSIEIILLREWDPIGISSEANAKDEYHVYAHDIAHMIAHGATMNDIADELLKIERDMMGLKGDAERANRVAKSLLP